MHKGRSYPFHPIYWATEGWFFPGFVPWKMHATFNGFDGLPWDYIGIGWQGTSEPGEVSLDRKFVFYEWDLSLFPPLVAFAITLVLDTTLPTWFSRFAIAITSLDAPPPAATAFDYQVFPQRVVACAGFSESTPFAPYTYDGPVDMILRPATYAEGGSPWP